MWQSFWHCKCYTYFFFKCDTFQAFWFSQVKIHKKKKKKETRWLLMFVSVLLFYALLLWKAPPFGENTNFKLIVYANFFFLNIFTSLLFQAFACLFFEILHETWPFSSLGRILLCGFDFNASLQNHPCAHRKLILSCVKQIHAPVYACPSFWNLKMINPIKLLYSPV